MLNKTGTIQILDADDKELEVYNIVVGSFLHVADGEKIEKGAVLAQWDPYNVPVLSEKGGSLHFKDMIPGVTVKRELDESSGRIATVVIEHKEDLNPQIEVRDAKNKPLAAYSIPVGAQIAVNEGDTIAPGALLAKTPRQASKTKDITGGLPRVAELFEARRPKDAAEMSRIDGIVSFEGTVRGKRKLVVKNEETEPGRGASDRRPASTSSCSRATWSTKASTLPKARLIRTKSWKSSGRRRSTTS